MIVNYAEDESVTVEDLGKEQTESIDWDSTDVDFEVD